MDTGINLLEYSERTVSVGDGSISMASSENESETTVFKHREVHCVISPFRIVGTCRAALYASSRGKVAPDSYT
jgi:hypothetical protein